MNPLDPPTGQADQPSATGGNPTQSAAQSAAEPGGEDTGAGLTGRRLGRYRVGEVLHDGPMSTLYRAVDVRLDRLVALKVISPLLAADEEFRARFVDEARNTSAIDHPHVVPVYDHDEIDEHLYLAMRYVDGPNLADLIAGHPLPLARVIALGAQVALALDAVHAHGLVHLDVKPANILITTAHQAHHPSGRPARGEHVYLADFGLTRRGATPAHTSTGAFLGSPAYAAPEHLRGQPVDAATDLYALGCVLHTALTGRAPFRGSVDDVIAGHLGLDRPPASLARTEHHPCPETGLALGPAADTVLARALAADPTDRPTSAGDLISELRNALIRDAQTHVPPPRPAPRRPAPPPTEPAAPQAPPRSAPSASAPSASAPSASATVLSRPGPGAPGPAEAGAGAPGSGSVHPDAVGRRLARPVAPMGGDPFTGGAPRSRPRNLHAVIAVTLGVLAVVLALSLALFLR